jgi:D-beta-D-heptose 7-phosphate kinase/D-beta-D-heptose 1-phosphate adenosyltransferase
MFHDIVENSKKTRLLVIGDVMLDHYIFGRCDRISPEAPVAVVQVKNEEITLGGAGNVVKNLISLGVQADILSVMGNDTTGNQIASLFDKIGVSTEGLFRSDDRITSKKSRILCSNQQMIRFDKETNLDIHDDLESSVTNYLYSNIQKYNLILISDYGKGVLTNNLLTKIFNFCNLHNVKTIVDPKGRDYKKYNGATIIKPNKKEASIAAGIARPARAGLPAPSPVAG